MKKIFVSDYDQTFYRNDYDIRKNIEAVKTLRKKGNLFVIATGRSYLSLKEEIKKFQIPYDYLILCHGAIILKNQKVIKEYTITQKIKNEIAKKLHLSKKKNYIATSSLENCEITTSHITRLHIYFDHLEDALKYQEFIQKKYKDFVNCYFIESNQAIEIISSETSKEVAISNIQNIENCNQVYTIGDGENDICMIEKYHGAIMINAKEELKNKNYKEYKSVSDYIKDVLENEE